MRPALSRKNPEGGCGSEVPLVAAETLMTDRAAAARLAEQVLEAAR
jgi:hypothetical protein